MERKNFKCYACHQSNNFYIQSTRIGNCCKFCGTYNYFKIKKNRYNHNYSNNNNQSSLNIQNLTSNICLNILDENSPLLPQNITINNSRNNNDININVLLDYDSINNNVEYDYNDFIFVKDEVVKYEWLTKVKATKDIIEKCGKDFVCSICYEGLKEKDNIHISKCKHVFHYNCIEKAIDNKFNECPLCRSNIQTGEQKHVNEVRNYYIENIENNDEYFPLNINNNEFIDENNNNQNNSRIKFFKAIKNCLKFLMKLFYLVFRVLFSIFKNIFNLSLISKIKDFSSLIFIIFIILLIIVFIYILH